MVVALVSAQCRAGEVKDYLSEDGKLKEKLRLTIIHHEDNAGRERERTTWSLEPSGQWAQTHSDSNFGIRPAITTVVAKGKLTAPQLAALAQHLATQDFNRLTARLGLKPAAAQRRYSTTLSFGKKTSALHTAGGLLSEGLPRAGDPSADDWSRIVALTLVVQNLLQEAKAEPKNDAPAVPGKDTDLQARFGQLEKRLAQLEHILRQLPASAKELPPTETETRVVGTWVVAEADQKTATFSDLKLKGDGSCTVAFGSDQAAVPDGKYHIIGKQIVITVKDDNVTRSYARRIASITDAELVMEYRNGDTVFKTRYLREK
jgi:hypothetical protein